MHDLDKFAAAVLVEAYLQLKRHPAMSRQAVAEDVSSQLRAYAWQCGQELKPTYHDAPEVELLLAQVEWVDTLGAQGVANGPSLLKDMVDLAKYHEAEYQTLLTDAKQAVPIPAEARAILMRQSVTGERPQAQPAAPASQPAEIQWSAETQAAAVQLLALCLYLHGGAGEAELGALGRLLQELHLLAGQEPQRYAALLENAKALLTGGPAEEPAQPVQEVPQVAEMPAQPAPVATPIAETPAEAAPQPATPEQLEAVRRYCREAGQVVTRSALERDTGLSWAVAEQMLAQTEDIVPAGEESCLAVSAFPVTLPLLDEMAETLREALAEHERHELTVLECRALLASRFPEHALATAELTNEGYYNALAYLLGLDFMFADDKVRFA